MFNAISSPSFSNSCIMAFRAVVISLTDDLGAWGSSGCNILTNSWSRLMAAVVVAVLCMPSCGSLALAKVEARGGRRLGFALGSGSNAVVSMVFLLSDAMGSESFNKEEERVVVVVELVAVVLEVVGG